MKEDVGAKRSWKDYNWSKHALERIAETKHPLKTIFQMFENSRERKRTLQEIKKDFMNRNSNNTLIENKSIRFVVAGRTVVTVINKKSQKYKDNATWAKNPATGKMEIVDLY